MTGARLAAVPPRLVFGDPEHIKIVRKLEDEGVDGTEKLWKVELDWTATGTTTVHVKAKSETEAIAIAQEDPLPLDKPDDLEVDATATLDEPKERPDA